MTSSATVAFDRPGSIAPTTPHSQYQPPVSQQIRDITSGICTLLFVFGGTCALVGQVTGILNPIGGAIFGGTASLIFFGGGALSEKFMEQTALKTAVQGVLLIAGIAAGFLVTNAMGFPLAVLGTVALVSVSSIFLGVIALITRAAMEAIFVGAF